jgi:Kef-type K+ transport system membrane component KefB
MNTRGLMELVVLNIGLEIQVISPALFSMMVVMAIVTTMMTPPLLHWFYPKADVQ